MFATDFDGTPQTGLRHRRVNREALPCSRACPVLFGEHETESVTHAALDSLSAAYGDSDAMAGCPRPTRGE